jgi:hypothetical protein
MLTQTQVARWATSVLKNTWLYKTDKGFLLPADVRWSWELTSLDDEEYLVTQLLYTTAKKAVYRIEYSTGTVDAAVPLKDLYIEHRSRGGVPVH